MVLTRARRAGIGRALMLALEDEARRRKRTTLVLDTRQGDPSERLYRSLGWQTAGVIPKYALNGEGGVDATVFYYKLLDA
jgi:ribosomal protein S18 acetylase RimI-like enzyme